MKIAYINKWHLHWESLWWGGYNVGHPSYGQPSMPVQTHDPSRAASHASASSTTHHHVHGPSFSGTACGSAIANPYYPFPQAPSAPPMQAPQPQQNLVQQNPPQQGQVYAQQNAPNPQNMQQKKRRRMRGRKKPIIRIKGLGQPTKCIGNPNQNSGPNNPPKQGKLRTNQPCSICGEYGYYTHHCPLLPKVRQAIEANKLKAAQALRGQAPIVYKPRSNPQVLQNSFPSQGFVAAQQPAPPPKKETFII